ncbi:5-(carboxyamino)imidazole ribonucleotide synthase [soil metagenome]
MSYNFSGQNFKLGILGGGQLGKMLIQEAVNLNISTAVMDPDASAPCRHLCEVFYHADFKNETAVYDFGKTVNMLTVEIEHVNTKALERLEAEGVAVYPQPQILRMVQDKGLQKEFYVSHGIPTANFKLIHNLDDLKKVQIQFPAILKMRTGGYDGKGVMKLKDASSLTVAFDTPSVLEEMVDFALEIAVIVSRNILGEIAHFPAVEMEFNPEANLVEFLCSPARISKSIEEEAIRIARTVIDKLGLVGILAVEMFVCKDGSVLVNEIAPRPHNSGHQTIEGNITSQYAQHLRSILGLPPGDTAIVRPAVMINLLGADGHQGEAHYHGIEKALALSGVYIHLYGKKITRPFRKMGHVTITADTLDEAITKARIVQSTIKVISTSSD